MCIPVTCPRCGSVELDGKRFCIRCGTALGPYATVVKSRATKIVGIGVIALALLLAVAVLLSILRIIEIRPLAERSGAAERGVITYRVTGTATSAHISYTNETDGTTNVESTLDPETLNIGWKQTVALKSGAMAYVTAQNGGTKGTVVAEIWYGDTLIKRSESSGEYCIATAAVRLE